MTWAEAVLLVGLYAAAGVVALRRLVPAASAGESFGYGLALGWTVAGTAIMLLGYADGAVTRTNGVVIAVTMSVWLLADRLFFPWSSRLGGRADGRRASRPEPTSRPDPATRRMRPWARWLVGLAVAVVALWAWWSGVIAPVIQGVTDPGSASVGMDLPGSGWAAIVRQGIDLTYPAGQTGVLDRPSDPVSVLASLLMLYGIDPAWSVALIATGLLVAVLGALAGLAVRIGIRPGTVLLALAVFVLAGGGGWILTLQRVNATDAPWAELRAAPWLRTEQLASGFTVENTVLANLLPFPQTGLVVLLLLASFVGVVERPDRSRWAIVGSGSLAGLAVVAQPAALPLVVLTGFTMLASRPTGPLTGAIRTWFPWRQWLVWPLVVAAVSWLAVVVPGGGDVWGRGQPRLTGDDPLIWFWLKNLAWLAPLVLVGVSRWGTLRPGSRRVVLLAVPALVAASVVPVSAGGPAPPALGLAMLVLSLPAAVGFAHLWRQGHGLLVRGLLLLLMVMVLGSGILANVQLLTG